MKWYLAVVLICTSLMTSDGEHLFTCLSGEVLAIFAHFKNWVCVLTVVLRALYILWIQGLFIRDVLQRLSSLWLLSFLTVSLQSRGLISMKSVCSLLVLLLF